jgi:ADP-ribose pyrophosphatase
MGYTLRDKRTVFSGKKVDLELHTLIDDDGKKHEREVVKHHGAVIVLGLTDNGEVLLIKVHRYPAGKALWELPAGTLEPGEDPRNCAGRELQEETGYLADRVEPMGWFYTSPGILTEKMHAFVATGLEAGEQALEEGEEITVHPTPLVECLEMIERGEIVDGKTMVALLRYERQQRAVGKE